MSDAKLIARSSSVVDYQRFSLSELATAVRRGELSTVELVSSALDNAAEQAELGGFVCLDAERALSVAASGPTGPLGGVPIAVKDLIDVAGLPTRSGTRASSTAPVARDAPIVTALRRAGAIVIGKTTTHELAYGVTTPDVVNPRYRERTAGGSSGGSAAVVAAGIVPLAIGTDTAGSVRIPAVCCGVCGLIPPPGSLPTNGVMALSPSFDTLGPIVRDPADLALAWSALAGPYDANQRNGDRERPRRVLVADPESFGRVAPEALAAVEAIASQLGFATTMARLPELSRFGAPRATVIGAEALISHRAAGLYPDRAADLGAEIRAADDAAAMTAPGEVEAARAELNNLGRELRAVLSTGDVLLTPALPSPPPSRARANEEVVSWMTRLVAPVNAARLAAAVIPVGDCGVQLIARDVQTLLGAIALL